MITVFSPRILKRPAAAAIPSDLLLHFEGADASTTFTDSSTGTGSPHTVTPAGNVQIDTAQFKFGTASGLFDGAFDYLTLDGSSVFAFGTGDFTIDFWARWAVTTAAGAIPIISGPAATPNCYRLQKVITTNILTWAITDGAAYNVVITGTTAVVINTWYHIAVTRSGTSTKLFLNGVQEGSTFSDTTNYTVTANRPAIGCNDALGSSFMNGWLDEIRVIKGTAAWTANFTPPTSAYTV